jgi:hypothetical protein
MVIQAWSRRSSGTQVINTPSGWTLIAHRSSNNLAYAAFGKKATGSESGSVNITTTTTSIPAMAKMSTYSGVDVDGTPYESAATTATTSGTNWSLVAMTVSNDGSMAVHHINGAKAYTANDDGTYFAEVYDHNTTLGNDAMIALYQLAYDSGSSDADTIGDNNSISWFRSEGVRFVLMPAATGYPNKIYGVAGANIAKINGVAVANIAKVHGV